MKANRLICREMISPILPNDLPEKTLNDPSVQNIWIGIDVTSPDMSRGILVRPLWKPYYPTICQYAIG